MGTVMLHATILLLVVLSSTSVSGDDKLHVFALPVGQGDATVIKCPDEDGIPSPDKLTIIDMGSSSSKEDGWMGEEQIKAFIEGHKVEYIFLTHPDIDHYNLISAVVGNVDKDTELHHSYAKDKYKYRRHIPLIDIKTKTNLIFQITKKDSSRGEKYPVTICGGAASIVVLASGLEDACKNKHNNNPASLVLQLKYKTK